MLSIENLAAFAQFGSDLDKATQNQLNRGQRLTELLKQPQFHPLTAEKQVIILYAGTQGFLDDIKVEDIRAFEDGLYKYLDSGQTALLNDIATKKALDDQLKKRIGDALTEYKANFLAEHQDAKVKRASEKAPDKQSPLTVAAEEPAGAAK